MGSREQGEGYNRDFNYLFMEDFLLFGHLPRVKIPNIISRLVQEYLYKLSGLSLSICWHVLLNLINNISVVMVITSVSFV